MARREAERAVTSRNPFDVKQRSATMTTWTPVVFALALALGAVAATPVPIVELRNAAKSGVFVRRRSGGDARGKRRFFFFFFFFFFSLLLRLLCTLLAASLVTYEIRGSRN